MVNRMKNQLNLEKKKEIRLLIRDGLFSTILSLFTCYLLSLFFFNTSFFNPLTKALKDFSFLDVYYAERLDENETVDTDIILINIEHQDRMALALALQEILRTKPKVVGFDIILKEFEETPADTLLAKLLKEDKVVGAYIKNSDATETRNHPFFQGSGTSGFVNFNFDFENTVVREFTGTHKMKDSHDEAFAVKLARKYLSKSVWEKKNLERRFSSSRFINYKGDLNRFLNLTIDEFMAMEDKSIFSGKAVLMGYLGSPTGNPYDVEDKHFSPLNATTAGKSIPDMYGLVIHANILSMILSDSFMFKISKFWTLFLMFLFSFLASTYFIWLDRRLKISYRTVRKALLFVFTVLLVYITLGLFKNGIVLKSAPIIFVTVFSAGFVKYYKHLVKYINTKRKFGSYLE